MDPADDDLGGVGAGGIDVQLLSVCLAALMALFRLPELCREIEPQVCVCGVCGVCGVWCVVCGVWCVV